LKFLIDENLSPSAARFLNQEYISQEDYGISIVPIQDRGLKTAKDSDIFNYAFEHDWIVVTANIKDFKRLAISGEIHPGIVFIEQGDLLRSEQISMLKIAVEAIRTQLEREEDMVNRVLYIDRDNRIRFENFP